MAYGKYPYRVNVPSSFSNEPLYREQCAWCVQHCGRKWTAKTASTERTRVFMFEEESIMLMFKLVYGGANGSRVS